MATSKGPVLLYVRAPGEVSTRLFIDGDPVTGRIRPLNKRDAKGAADCVFELTPTSPDTSSTDGGLDDYERSGLATSVIDRLQAREKEALDQLNRIKKEFLAAGGSPGELSVLPAALIAYTEKRIYLDAILTLADMDFELHVLAATTTASGSEGERPAAYEVWRVIWSELGVLEAIADALPEGPVGAVLRGYQEHGIPEGLPIAEKALREAGGEPDQAAADKTYHRGYQITSLLIREHEGEEIPNSEYQRDPDEFFAKATQPDPSTEKPSGGGNG